MFPQSIDIVRSDNSLLVQNLRDQLKRMLSIDYNEHDDAIFSTCKNAIGRVESHTGLLLSSATVTATYPVTTDKEDLPRLPHLPIVSVESAVDGANTALVVTPNGYGFLSAYCPTGLTLVYKAGYENLPDDLQQAALLLAANLFDGGNRDWKTWASSYRRNTWAD